MINAHELTLQRHFSCFTKIERLMEGKQALESPPNRVNHESVAVVLKTVMK